MKKYAIAILLVGFIFLFTGCGKEEDGTTIYKAKDIFIRSFECGYLGASVPKGYIIIETEEQLAYAKENYACLNEMNEFKEMLTECPLDNHIYLMLYNEVLKDGYNIQMDRVKVEKTKIGFEESWKSHGPRSDDGPAVMYYGGFFHMAAIPKEYLEGCDFSEMRATFPGKESEESEELEEESSYQAVTKEDVIADEETEMEYVKNQVVVCTVFGTLRTEVEKLASELGAAIVGGSETAGVYQMEFLEDKSYKELEEIAEELCEIEYISYATLNYVE